MINKSYYMQVKYSMSPFIASNIFFTVLVQHSFINNNNNNNNGYF